MFYDKCTKIRRFLETECNKESKIVVSTPNNFLGLKIENHFVIIEDPHLIGPFGYLETIKKIKNNNSLIALTDKALKYEFLKDPIMVSSTRKCFIKCNNEESFIILFCVIKFNIIRDDLSVVVVSKEMKTKVQIFLKVFGYEGFNRVYLPEECEGGRILAFSDTLLEIEGVDVIYLSKKNIEGIKESQFDFKKADKFIYRIRNVLQSITPSIFKGKKDFDLRDLEV